MKLYKTALLSFIALLFCLMLIGCSSSPNYATRREIMMDTFVTIKVYAPEKKAEQILDEAFKELKKVEKFSSFHITNSIVYQLNHKKQVKLTASFSRLLQLSFKAYKLTDNYFDPSFALLEKAYGFYNHKGRLPEKKELKQLLAHVGFDKVISVSSNSIKLASASLLDFGGIAGGYAIEKAINVIRAASCTAFFIDDGGDIWIEGKKPDKSPWRIAVKDPRNNGQLALIETYKNVAISTSGDYERFVTVNGKRYGHIMNPKTGIPADHYSSVTVIASSPYLADIYSTTLFAMPAQTALNWASKLHIPLLAVTASGTVLVNSSGKLWYKNIKF